MKLEDTDITAALKQAENYLKTETGLSLAFVISMQLILTIVKLLVDKLKLNSSNSSIPPSQDPDRKKKKKGKGKKAGGQKGHEGKTLQKVANPEIIKEIPVDLTKLPAGDYKTVDYESRQVIEIEISRVVTEYRAQVVEDKTGRRFIADFPEGVVRPVQYGNLVVLQCE